jgi:spore maturation protein CgeB
MVISDAVVGLDGSLGDAVVTYEDRQDLAAAIERLLSDPGERSRRAEGARERILAGETFDHRAAELVRWVRETQASEHGDRRMQVAN